MQAKNIVPDIAAAMNSIENLIEHITDQFKAAAEEHYKRASIVTRFFTKIFPRAPFDLETELYLMDPIDSEYGMEFVNAHYQYKWFMGELANAFNEIGKMGEAYRAGALHVDIDVNLLYVIKMLASGKHYFEVVG